MKLEQWEKIEVEWLDSAHTSGWRSIKNVEENLKREELLHRTVGYLFKDTGYSLAIVQSIGPECKENDNIRNVDAIMEIPKAAITKIEILS